jgi:hypothetical protein
MMFVCVFWFVFFVYCLLRGQICSEADRMPQALVVLPLGHSASNAKFPAETYQQSDEDF